MDIGGPVLYADISADSVKVHMCLAKLVTAILVEIFVGSHRQTQLVRTLNKPVGNISERDSTRTQARR